MNWLLLVFVLLNAFFAYDYYRRKQFKWHQFCFSFGSALFTAMVLIHNLVLGR